MEMIICALLLGALVGAVVQRFVMSKWSRYRHFDLDGWLILIEDGARTARESHAEGMPLLARAMDGSMPTPEERAFLYGYYRELVPSTNQLPTCIIDRHGFGPDRA